MDTASESAQLSTATSDPQPGLHPHKLLALYHTMVMARALERRIWVLNRLSNLDVAIPVSGFEAIQAAAAAALRPGVDWIVPHQSDLALCLAMGLSPADVMFAVFGRASDPSSGGRQSPGNFGLKHVRIVSTSALLGTQVVHAAGIAYASRLRGLDEVTLVTISEPGTATGDWHEGLNFSAVHRLPLVCIVQDGSQRMGVLGQSGSEAVARRAAGYGIRGETVDGTDFPAGFASITRAFERARAGEGPTLVHARVVELTSLAHTGGLRPQEEMEALAWHDPIELMRRHLHESRMLDDSTDHQIQRDAISVVDAAVEQAQSAPAPEPTRALDNVFSGRL